MKKCRQTTMEDPLLDHRISLYGGQVAFVESLHDEFTGHVCQLILSFWGQDVRMREYVLKDCPIVYTKNNSEKVVVDWTSYQQGVVIIQAKRERQSQYTIVTKFDLNEPLGDMNRMLFSLDLDPNWRLQRNKWNTRCCRVTCWNPRMICVRFCFEHKSWVCTVLIFLTLVCNMILSTLFK